MKYFLAPSILSADFGLLKEQIEIINSSEADYIHIDVMDGVFVPNISFGFPVIESIARYSKKPLDVHLMIMNPENYISRIAEFNPEFITVHFEAQVHLNRTISLIKSFDSKAAIALNPHTNVSLLEDILPFADMILLMSVNPGFGGQKFISQIINKIEKLNTLIIQKGLDVKIEVDGGIDNTNIKEVIKAGANIIVAGNSIFKEKDIKQTINNLKNIK